jgi:hypothetical protein
MMSRIKDSKEKVLLSTYEAAAFSLSITGEKKRICIEDSNGITIYLLCSTFNLPS